MYQILGIVLSFREKIRICNEHENPEQREAKGRQQLEKLMSLSSEELHSMASKNMPRLQAMIEASLQADDTLSPREFNSSLKDSVTNVVLQWQLNATRAALDRSILQSATPAPNDSDRDGDAQFPTESYPTSDVQPPTLKRINPLDDVELQGPLKARKVLRVAGVPTGETDDDGQDFWSGLGGAAHIRPSQLKSYPGRSSVLLNVQELMGPSILHSFCQEGLNIELVVRHVRWPRQADGRPFQSEIEALTLARILNFHFSKCKSME